jgi:hypothetical protein
MIKLNNELLKGTLMQECNIIYTDDLRVIKDDKPCKTVSINFNNCVYKISNYAISRVWTLEECKEDFDYLIKYNNWRKEKGARRVNLSGELGESLVCHHENSFVRFSGCTNKKGDLIHTTDNILAEVKLTSGVGPISFSPKSLSEIYFIISIDKNIGFYQIYKLHHTDLHDIKINSNLTFKQASDINNERIIKNEPTNRPRFRFHDYIANTNKVPVYSGYLI